VTAVPIRTAKDKLSALVDQVEGTHERVTITRNGTPVAVLISPDDLEALEETLDVLSDADLMAQLRQSQDELRRGDTYSETELRELMAQRRRAE
jgi:antitoxin YefM